ncbi:MAG TPA: GNAT family N-acetyltransferase, partial [Actinomycetota bacterium]|nr:GNAT family N-acetyltransferase [Actinomycetota bacterium]
DDPLLSHVLPDPQDRTARLPEYFEIFVRLGLRWGEAYELGETPDGAAVWQPPGADVTPEVAVEAGLTRLGEVVGADAVLRLGHALDFLESLRTGLPPEHWYLMVVGVTPSSQGRGLGSQLLQPVLDRVDAAGLPCYLDTGEPRNLPFYERLGFVVHVEAEHPDSGITFRVLRRDPR